MVEATKDEVAAALGTLGTLRARQGQMRVAVRAPLPQSGTPTGISSEVEWI